MLQSVAQVRNWVVTHIPLTASLVGYDLFLKLGNDIAAGLPLDVDRITAGLPHAREEVLAHLELMAQARLVGFGELGEVCPTPDFLALLDEYGRTFDSLFIVREDLRGQQLLIASADPQLGALGRLLYDRIYDLGWLYLHNFGSVCFLMASLVRRIAVAHGQQARIVTCYAEVAYERGNYLLGAPGYAKPGQVEGHAACVIDERVLVDFGLGNVRKGYRRDFPWGVVCDYRRDGAAIGTAQVGAREIITWKDDWQSPAAEAELARYAPHIEDLFGQYAARFL